MRSLLIVGLTCSSVVATAAPATTPTLPSGLAGYVALHEIVDAHPPDVAHTLLETAAGDTSRTPLFRAQARWHLARLARRQGEAAAVESTLESIGFVTGWEVIGPFRPGTPAADAPMRDALDRPEVGGERAYLGKEHSVAWRPVPSRLVLDGFAALDDVLHNPVPGVVYLRAALPARAAATALRVGASVPYAVWVDGAAIGASDARRPLWLDQDAWRLPARSTAGVVLVRLEATAGPIRFGLRLAPLGDGPAIDDPVARAEAEVAEARTVSALRTYAALLARVHPHDRDDPRARRAWRAAVEAAPRDVDSLVGLALAERLDRDARRTALDRAVQLEPGHPGALAALARHQDARGLAYDAEALWRRVAAARPGDGEAALSLAREPHRMGLRAEALGYLEGAWQEGARSPALGAALVNELLDRDRVDDAEGVARGLVSVRADDERSWSSLRRVAERRGDRALQAEALTGARAFAGRAPGAEARSPVELEVLQAATREAPDSPALWAATGQALQASGDRAGALEAFRRSLELAPQQAEIRRIVAWLDPTDEALRDIVDRYGRDILDVVAGPPSSPDAGAGAWYLFDQSIVEVHRNGLATRLRQYAIRLEDTVQHDAVRYHWVSYSPADERVRLVSAEVVHPDGTRTEPTRAWTEQPFGKVDGVYSDHETRVWAFDQLAPGDVVHVAYVVEQIGATNQFGDFFGHFEAAQGLFPKASWVLEVRAPRRFDLRHHAVRLEAPSRRDDGRTRSWRWSARPLPGLPPGPYAPGYPERGAYVSVSTFESWDAVGRWYANFIEGQATLNDEMTTLARRLAADSGDEIRAVVAAMFEHVVRETRYVGIEFGVHGYRPYRADVVLQRGYGDCKDKANLLIALLRAVGIEAQIVLVRTFDRGVPAEQPPSPWLFNHAIAYVPALDLYLDATTEHGGPTELPFQDQGGLALRVTADGGRLVRLPVDDAAKNHWEVEFHLRVQPDGAVALDYDERISGAGAAESRAALQDPTRAVRGIEQRLSRWAPGAAILGVRALDHGRLAPARLAFTAAVPGVVRDGQIEISPFPLEVVERYAPGAERTMDLRLPYPWSHRQVVHLSLDDAPEGVRVEPPPDADFQTVFGAYSRRASRTGGGWRIERTVSVRIRDVERDAYPAFREFLEAVDRAEQETARLHAGRDG
jgi:tetratricopeptide (TPR) repeat protein